MENQNDMDTGPLWSLLKSLLTFTMLCVVGLVLYVPMEKYISGWGESKYTEEQLNEWTNQRMDSDSGPEIVDGIHIASGMVYDENFDVVKATCTSCHSSKLIIQNRATREGWKDMIVWMQETQGLPDLGNLEPIVLDYLATHYAPEQTGRRSNLDIEAIEWYVLDQSD